MMFEKKTVRLLYKKLLTLYPKVFREQFGESMEQTFNDLCNERKQQTKRGLYGFMLWIFAETSTGIVKEHILLIKHGDYMKNISSNLKSAAIISFIIVLPFALLEFTFNTVTKQNVPDLTVLFGLLWLLSMAFIVIMMPIVQNIRAGNSVAAKPINLLLRVAFSALIVMMWAGIIIDQLPCFLGVPNCD